MDLVVHVEGMSCVIIVYSVQIQYTTSCYVFPMGREGNKTSFTLVPNNPLLSGMAVTVAIVKSQELCTAAGNSTAIFCLGP